MRKMYYEPKKNDELPVKTQWAKVISKHLADTEAAAEYWKAMLDARDAELDWMEDEGSLEASIRADKRCIITARFATHPHAAGDDYR